MPRYNGNDQTPRSKQRKHVMLKRGLLTRENKDDPRSTRTYQGYAHGKTGPSGDYTKGGSVST